MDSIRTVTTPGGMVTYTLTRKAVRRVNLRVRSDGTVAVSAPAQVPAGEIDRFVAAKGAWVRTAQARAAALPTSVSAPRTYAPGDRVWLLGVPHTVVVEAGRPEAVDARAGVLRVTLTDPTCAARRKQRVETFLTQESRAVFQSLLRRWWPSEDPPPLLRVRDMRSRWGSCIPAKSAITLNRRLLSAPLSCIEYVVVHELCHLTHPNHGPGFYGALAALLPDWQARKTALNTLAKDWF